MFSLTVNEDISLALVQPSFAKDYFKLVGKQADYLGKFLPWVSHAKDEQFFSDFIKSSLHAYAEGTAMRCAIVYQGQVVGNASLENINHNLKSTKIGYWLDKDHQGNGIVTQVVKKLIDIAFHELALTKVIIQAATDNLPSRAVPERLGFNLEGILTQNENVNGRLVDHAVYATHKS